MTDSIVISGFGREDVNGVYTYWQDRNGYPAYKNALDYIVMYVNNRMPYANDAGYVLLIRAGIQGAIPIELYPYIKTSDVSNVTTSGWTSTIPYTSGQTDVDTPWIESSSESTPSSGSSNSSSNSSSSSSTGVRSSSSSSSTSSSSSSSSSSNSSSSSTMSSLSSNSSSSKSESSSSSDLSESSPSSSLSSLSSNSSSSSSIDSSSSSSADILLRVTNSGSANINGDYTFSGTVTNGQRVFDQYNLYYFAFNGSQWVLTDDLSGKTIARWSASANGLPDGINSYYNTTDFPFASGTFVTQINASEFSQSSASTDSSSSSS